MKATTSDSFFHALDAKLMCSTIYQVLLFNERFDIEVFKKSLRQVMDEVEILTCKLKEGWFRDSWIRTEIYDIENIFNYYEIDHKNNDFYNEAFEYFTKIDNKHINIVNELPIKFHVIKDTTGSKTFIAIALHHSVSDTIGWMEVLENIGIYYRGNLCNKKTENLCEFNKERKLTFKLYESVRKHYNSNKKKSNKNVKTVKKMTPLIELNKRDAKNTQFNLCNIEAMKIKKDDVQRLRSRFHKYNFTINDIMTFLNLKLNYILDRTDNDVVLAGYRVNTRRYAELPEKLLGNYSFVQYVFLNKKDINNIEKITQAISNSKEEVAPLNELYSYKVFAKMPIKIVKKLLNLGLVSKGKEFGCGVTTTNIGASDKYLNYFGECIDESVFIPSSFSTGMPLIGISGFKGEINIVFILYNDNKRNVAWVKEEFEKLLNTYLS